MKFVSKLIITCTLTLFSRKRGDAYVYCSTEKKGTHTCRQRLDLVDDVIIVDEGQRTPAETLIYVTMKESN